MPERTVQIGTERVPVPPLSAPIGPEALRGRYPRINSPSDVALVDRYLAAVSNLGPISPAGAGAEPAAPRNALAVAQAVRNWKADRNGAIAAFQQAEAIGGQEVQDKIILPDGKTWETLTTYGELALRLEAVRDRPKDSHDYIHTGGFDEAAFLAEVIRRFRADPLVATRFSQQSVPGMLDLLGRISRDARVIDVRWIAYMLATAFWESASLISIPQPPKPPRKEWRSMEPSREMGLGKERNYYLPVKVQRLADGRAQVLEQDGDCFVVSSAGDVVERNPAGRPGAMPGVPPHAKATPDYLKAAGSELAFYGRGYVQLTWWANYAKNGAAVGLGLELLFTPDRALEPDIAYRIMSDGMLYGVGYANRHRLQHYIYASRTDYAGARAIVNARDPVPSIVRAAELFEASLMATKA